MSLKQRLYMAVLVVFGLAGSQPASAQLAVSPDISVEIGGVTVDHDELYSTASLGAVTTVPLPNGVDLNGYEEVPGGVYFSVDVTTVVAGTTIEPRDVASWDGTSVSLVLDGDVEGIPNGAGIDAIMRGAGGGLFISLDTSANIAGLDVDDEDLFRLSTPLLIFDGSAEGVDPGLDLNAATLQSAGVARLSFDGGGVVDGIAFEDEDLIIFDTGAGTFAFDWDGSALSANLVSADLTAVPETGSVVGLAMGAGLLFGLGFAQPRFALGRFSRTRLGTRHCKELRST